MMDLAGYNGQGRSDIPVNKNHNRGNSNGASPDRTYSYEDLVRRKNAQAAAEKTQPPQVNSQQYAQQRQQQAYNQQYAQQRQQQAYNQQYAQQRQQQVYNYQPAQQPQQSKNFNDYKKEFDNNQIGFKKRQEQSTEYSKGGNWSEPEKRKKRRGGFFKVILSLLLVAVLIYCGITGYIYSIFSNVEYNNTGDGNSAETIVNMLNKEYVYNILLIGVDDRKEGQTSRSDTMILLSIDKENKQIKMLSFMRDTYVTIPGHGSAKLNAACTYGGPELVMETIEDNFGVEIDNYVLVDFNAFKDVIDSLGGVTVEVEQREAEYINRTSRQKIDYGENIELNGEEALVYVRIRYLDSDFYRTQRQRKVISAVIEAAKKSNPLDLIETGKDVMTYIETDMSPLQLTVLAESALFYLKYDIVQARVPFDGEYSNQTINGQDVLAIDLEATKELIDEFIYEKVEEEKETTSD